LSPPAAPGTLPDNGQIVEENLFYDLVTFMRQLGLSG
jgi:hypothetical protein